jgi:hypothetical protein
MGKYLKILWAKPETSKETGADSIAIQPDNIFWKQIHDWCKIGYDYDKRDASENPTPTKTKELKVSDEIWNSIREVYKVLNSSTPNNFAPGRPPDSDHLKM